MEEFLITLLNIVVVLCAFTCIGLGIWGLSKYIYKTKFANCTKEAEGEGQ